MFNDKESNEEFSLNDLDNFSRSVSMIENFLELYKMSLWKARRRTAKGRTQKHNINTKLPGIKLIVKNALT